MRDIRARLKAIDPGQPLSRVATLSAVVARSVARPGLTCAGAALGLAAAAVATRSLGQLLFRVTPLDPTTYGGVTLLVLSVAALSLYLPVRQAVRVDPLPVLRGE